MNIQEFKTMLGDFAERDYGVECVSPHFLQTLCREGALLDENGNRFPLPRLGENPEELENKILSAINGGKELYFYGKKENYPHALKASIDKKTLKLSGSLEHDAAPEPVQEPSFFQNLFDGILKIFGSRMEVCKKYDEYMEEQANFNKRKYEDLADKFAANRPERDRQIRFRVAVKHAMEDIDNDFKKAKELYNYDNVIKTIQDTPAEERTREQKNIKNMFIRVENVEEPNLHQKLFVLAAANQEKVDASNAAEDFLSPKAADAEKIKALHAKCPSHDFTNQKGISGLVVVPGNTVSAHDKFMEYFSALANVETNEFPQRRAQDITYLRGVVAENIGIMNTKLANAGIDDNVVIPAEANAIAAFGRVAEDIHAKGQLTADLAKYLVQKGEHDPMMVSMCDRAGALTSFVGFATVALGGPERLAVAYQTLSSFKNNLDINRTGAGVTKQYRDNMDPEVLKACDAEAAKTRFNGAKPQEPNAAQAHSQQPEPQRVVQAEAAQHAPKPQGPMM